MVERVNILGTDYDVFYRKYEDDPVFESDDCCGYCDADIRVIVVGDLSTFKNWSTASAICLANAEKETLRHEIVHAFFNESGLQGSAGSVKGSWAHNEEMVDWFAIQGPKIYKAWQDANAL